MAFFIKVDDLKELPKLPEGTVILKSNELLDSLKIILDLEITKEFISPKMIPEQLDMLVKYLKSNLINILR